MRCRVDEVIILQVEGLVSDLTLASHRVKKFNIEPEIVPVVKVMKFYDPCFSLKGATRLTQGWRISKHI